MNAPYLIAGARAQSALCGFRDASVYNIATPIAGLGLAWLSSMTTHARTCLSFVIPLGVLAATWLHPHISTAQAQQDPSVQQEASPEQDSAAARRATATIANLLPVDGCSYPVTIDGVDYAPTASSASAIQDLVPAGGTLTVRIQYRLTGRTGQVECGFGTSQELPEIAFRVIRVIDDE
jgi:hypothetical protein